jgi:hypothetical protein
MPKVHSAGVEYQIAQIRGNGPDTLSARRSICGFPENRPDFPNLELGGSRDRFDLSSIPLPPAIAGWLYFAIFVSPKFADNSGPCA